MVIHWMCNVQAGAIHGLVVVLKDLKASLRALAHASFVLKRLTATKYNARASFVMSEGPAALLDILKRSAQREGCALLPLRGVAVAPEGCTRSIAVMCMTIANRIPPVQSLLHA